MIDNRITPQVMCGACGHIFPHPTVLAETANSDDITLTEEVICPACEIQGKPKGIMQPSGFPSLETFEQNWKKSKSVTTNDTKSLAKSS